MIRSPSSPRPNLAKQIASTGFGFATVDDNPYWDESARYEFTLDEIEQQIEKPTEELYALCLDLVDRAVTDEMLLRRLGIPPRLQLLAKDSWRNDEPSLYGRFDFSLSPDGAVKLLEFNADTPTSLFESAVFQWTWLEDCQQQGELAEGVDQFNSIHEALIQEWKKVANGQRVHFASMPNEEDAGTTSYIRETARLAGVRDAGQLRMRDIGLLGDRFVGFEKETIDCLFKLYPWEWLIADEFGASPAMQKTRFVEPAWKAILATKAILPILWEMAPGHPNLLPARFEDEGFGADVGSEYVRKRCYSREGANIDVVINGATVESTPGEYGGRSVIQRFCPLPDFGGNRPVIGSWVVGRRSCGMGIRESSTAITTNTSRFVPHLIKA